jgi:hypothetical protein
MSGGALTYDIIRGVQDERELRKGAETRLEAYMADREAAQEQSNASASAITTDLAAKLSDTEGKLSKMEGELASVRGGLERESEERAHAEELAARAQVREVG